MEFYPVGIQQSDALGKEGMTNDGLPLEIAIAQLRINHNHIRDLHKDIREKLNMFA